MTVKRALRVLAGGMMLSQGISAATTLDGVVVDAAKSTPIYGATVSVDILIPDSVTFKMSTDSSGRYSLSGMPGGNAIYVIRCYRAGFAPFYMRYDALSLGDRHVDILMYPQSEEPPGGGGDSADVSGLVLYETAARDRNPVAQATVILRTGGTEFPTFTDTEGKYSLYVRRGNYALSVAAPNFETLTAGGLAVDSAGLVLNVLLKSTAVSVSPALASRAAAFTLENAYPNPFNPTTGIRYQVSGVSDVKIAVYDVVGREVAVLVNEGKRPGSYEVTFDGSGLASGVYLYRMTALQTEGGQGRNFSQTRKLCLIK